MVGRYVVIDCGVTWSSGRYCIRGVSLLGGHIKCLSYVKPSPFINDATTHPMYHH